MEFGIDQSIAIMDLKKKGRKEGSTIKYNDTYTTWSHYKEILLCDCLVEILVIIVSPNSNHTTNTKTIFYLIIFNIAKEFQWI